MEKLGSVPSFPPSFPLGAAAISWVVLGRLRQHDLSRIVISSHRVLVVLTTLGFLWVL